MYSKIRAPQLEKHIDRDLSHARDIIITGLNDPSATLWLFGGYGRGEGGCKIDNNRLCPSNNYDILLVAKNPLSRYWQQRQLKSIQQTLSHSIANPVDLSIINLSALSKPSMLAFDVCHASRPLNGQTVYTMLGHSRTDHIAKTEAINVLRNRTVLYLLASEESAQSDRFCRLLSKFIIAFIDAICILDDCRISKLSDKMAYINKSFNDKTLAYPVTQTHLKLFNLALDYRYCGDNGYKLCHHFNTLPQQFSVLCETLICAATERTQTAIGECLQSSADCHPIKNFKNTLALRRTSSNHPLLGSCLHKSGTAAILSRVFQPDWYTDNFALNDAQLIALHRGVFE